MKLQMLAGVAVMTFEDISIPSTILLTTGIAFLRSTGRGATEAAAHKKRFELVCKLLHYSVVNTE